ncbi:MAG: PAS domain S-box protein [Acetobacteraceae bacterium]
MSEPLTSPTYQSALLAKAVADCALFMLDPEGRVRSWSPGAERIKGYAAAEIIGQHFSCFFTDADRQAGAPQRVLATAAEHGRYEEEGVFVRNAGSTFWASLVVEPIRDDTGQLIGYANITRDISQRKLVEERLLGEQAKYRAIIETAVDGIVVIDERAIVQAFNRAAEMIFGYSADEVIGHNVSCLMPEPDRSQHDGYIANFRRTGEAKIIGARREVTGQRKDGSVFALDLSIAEWHAGGQRYFTAIVHDITARKAADENMKRTIAMLHRAQKMEVVGRITGGVAHDFNNILQVMIGSLDMADALTGGNEELRRLLSAVRRGAVRAERVTQQLLAFSRQQPLHPQEVDVSLHMREAVDLFARTLRGDIYVEVDLPGDLWPIMIDASQLDLAVLNIAVNARDAMPNGGTFKISARNATYQGLTIEQGNHGLDGSYVVMTLSDTGEGIAPDVLPHVFEPFFTTKDVGKGTGLGLSQVYGFALQSGGVATVASKVGQGTIITLYFPALDHGAHVGAPDGTAETTSTMGTVLVVEDDADVAELATKVLKDAGYAVAQAEHAPAALTALASGAPIDLVFSDIVLPRGMSGITLAHEVRTLYPKLPVLLTTGYAEALADAEVEGLTILRKPYHRQDLLGVIDSMLRGRNAVPPPAPVRGAGSRAGMVSEVAPAAPIE